MRREQVTEKVKVLDGLDTEGLDALRSKVREKPEAARRTLKATTVCQGAMVNHSFIRDLDAFVIDEPPNLLGTDTTRTLRRWRWALASRWGSCPTRRPRGLH